MTNKSTTFSEVIRILEEDYNGVKICQLYFSHLGNLELSDEQKLLKEVISYNMKPNNKDKPFDPMMIIEGRRSAIPDDLSDEDIQRLIDRYEQIKESELKARFADILWLKKREIQYAHDAISAYIESAKNLREESWTYSQDRIERALRLSLSLGKEGAKDFDKVISYIREILANCDLEKEKFFPLQLVRLLLKIDYSEKEYCISILENCVQLLKEKGDFYELNGYLELLANWHEKNKDSVSAQENRKMIAENHVRTSQLEQSAMGKTHYLQKAIEILRRAGDSKNRINELHAELLDVQKNIPDEMESHSIGKIDVTESLKISIDHVKGFSKKDALVRFCFITQPTDIKSTLNTVEKQAEQFIHTMIFGKISVNKEGKTIAHASGLMSSDLPREEKLFPQLVEHMNICWGFNAQCAILPAKDQITLEHDISEEDIEEFVADNPLIRHGHEVLFIQGIMFGFQGRWDLAGSILVVQFEDSLRYLLEKRGVLTSNIKSDFTQEERGTSYFFKNHSNELKEIFGEDIFYELKALLVKDDNGNGVNLRNLIAHGIMTQDEFYNGAVIYFWWLVFRMICTPHIQQKRKHKED